MGLRLFAVTLLEGPAGRTGDGVQLVAFRDLAAAVGEAPYTVDTPAAQEIARHHEVVEALAAARPVLPAPVGSIFRSRDTLTQWLELHYVTFTDALAYVEDRVEARVHITRGSGPADEREAGADLAAAAAESFRAMRRGAVASVPLKTEHMTGIVVSAGFLVDRELWKQFVDIVEAEQETHPDLRIDLSGPWPAYDFVRMQFGA